MVYEIFFSGIHFEVYNFPEGFLMNNWGWKIDQWKRYSVLESSMCKVVSISKSSEDYISTEYFPLLYKEKNGFFEHHIYCLPNNDTLWDFIRIAEKKVYLRFRVSSKWDKITLLEDLTYTHGCAAFEYLAQIMPSICLKHNLLTLHASLVELDGQAIAICAPSGTGKTTHARLWRDCKNALILNGDRAVCKNTEQGWRAYGTPWSGTSGEQINRSASLKAIVVLERGEKNVVRRLSGIETFSGIFPHVLYSSWDRDLTECAMTQLDNLLCTIPVYHLCCRPDKDAVEVLYRAVWGK